jgi:hypothetical protein
MNTELARLVIKQAEAFPDELDMSSYARTTPCGTTACLAGWAMLMSGYQARREDGWLEKYGDLLFFRPDDTQVDNEWTEGLMLLGISEEEEQREMELSGTGEALFYGGLLAHRALARLRAMTERAERDQGIVA